jgi:hypothetical protein
VVGGPTSDVARADDWSACRLAQLVRRPVLDCRVGTGEAPTVRYVAGWGNWTLDDRDPESAALDSPAPAPSAYDSAAWLSERAVPRSIGFRSDWAGLGVRLAVASPTRLTLRFPNPHPRPEALVACLLDDAIARHTRPADWSRYGITRYRPATAEGAAADSISYARARPAGKPASPIEIVERRFDDEDAALSAFVEGSIDVVDRVAPWQTGELRRRPDVALRRYGPMVVHYLRLRTDRGPMRRASFRRALEYAIDREWILRNELRPSADERGVQTTRCILPLGRGIDDPLGYAGTLGIRPRPYDPQQAFVLARAGAPTPTAAGAVESTPSGTTEIAAADAPPPTEPIVVSYPPSAVAERACRRLQNYWRNVGIEVELRRRSSDSAAGDSADVAYVVLHTSEPLVAVVDCFIDPQHPSASTTAVDSATGDALRRAVAAESFPAARKALGDLQQAAVDDSLVIPLWQLNAYIAHRGRVTLGAAEFAPTTLYQFVDEWRVAPKVSLPLP